ncbi:MAG: hypothetical protein JW936_06945 [Sedimentisphaerales bacterium]|nr:hypothetical protein [Sedimentisphaerales bacterium]
MPSARASSDNKNSTLYALILFVILFLASTVFTIILYMNNSDLQTAADEAISQRETLASTSEYNAIKALAITTGGRVRTSAMSRVTQQFRDIARAVDGTESEDFPVTGAATTIINSIDNTWEEAQDSVLGSESLSRDIGLNGLAQWLIEQTSSWQSRCIAAETTMIDQADMFQKQADDNVAAMDEIRQQLATATRLGQQQVQAYEALHADETQRYEEIITSLNNQLDYAQNQERASREQVQEMQQTVADFEAEVQRLNERLQMFQPDPETEAAALEPDGHIVSVVLRDGFAYINLGRNDHIYRGLTFTVYDSYQPIPRSGQGKGNIEVIEIMDQISKCRIVDYDRTNPILDGDTIANVVWNADKEYLFSVIGDFDFDGDGNIDPDGRDQIVRLIEAWGGRATDRLTVDTDFLVVGRPPIVAEPTDLSYNDNSPAAQAYQLATARAEAYENALQRANMLGVPTFNQSRFFNFIGYRHQPRLRY